MCILQEFIKVEGDNTIPDGSTPLKARLRLLPHYRDKRTKHDRFTKRIHLNTVTLKIKINMHMAYVNENALETAYVYESLSWNCMPLHYVFKGLHRLATLRVPPNPLGLALARPPRR